MTSYQYDRINQTPKPETFETGWFDASMPEHRKPEPPRRDYHAAYGQLRRDLRELAADIEEDQRHDCIIGISDILSQIAYLAGDEDDGNV